MASLPSPPFIPIEGIHNFRSIGGYPTRTTKPTTTNTRTPQPPTLTRSNLLYRSAEPSQITPSGILALKALNITTIFDLRSLPEIEKLKARTPVVEIDGIERVFAPIFRDRDYSPEAIALRYQAYTSGDGSEGFRRVYADILESGAGAYRRIFEHLRDKPREACLVHCTAGKDRTGILVALVLLLVGVEDEVIAWEYALTEVGLAQWKEVIVQHLLEDMKLHGGREGVERLLSARAENMLATLEMIRSRFQGAENYLKQKCGFTDGDIQIIRANILETPNQP